MKDRGLRLGQGKDSTVEYKLHPTFPKPVCTISDRATKFRLDAHGWGVFPIHVNVHKTNGDMVKLEHDLVLKYDDGTPTTN
jgi:transcription initiation factor IIF auxiliary subunit